MSINILGKFKYLKAKLGAGILGSSANVATLALPFTGGAVNDHLYVGSLIGVVATLTYTKLITCAWNEKKRVESLFNNESEFIPDKDIWLRHVSSMYIESADDLFEKIQKRAKHYSGLNIEDPVKKDKYIKGFLGSMMYGADKKPDNMRIFPEGLFFFKGEHFDKYLSALDVSDLDLEVITHFKEKELSKPRLWIEYLAYKDSPEFNPKKIELNIGLDMSPDDFIFTLSNEYSVKDSLPIEGLEL